MLPPRPPALQSPGPGVPAGPVRFGQNARDAGSSRWQRTGRCRGPRSAGSLRRRPVRSGRGPSHGVEIRADARPDDEAHSMCAEEEGRHRSTPVAVGEVGGPVGIRTHVLVVDVSARQSPSSGAMTRLSCLQLPPPHDGCTTDNMNSKDPGNRSHTKKPAQPGGFSGDLSWWLRVDLNHRPCDYESHALTS